MLYAAKCYWPGVTRTDVEQVAAQGRSSQPTMASAVSDRAGPRRAGMTLAPVRAMASRTEGTGRLRW